MKRSMLKNVTISSVGIMSLLPLFGFTSLQNTQCVSSLKTKQIGAYSDSGSEIDDVVKRFEREVTLHHSKYVDEYVADWKKQPKNDTIQEWSARRAHTSDFMHWEEASEWNWQLNSHRIGLKDIEGKPLSDQNARPRIICNQNKPTNPTTGMVFGCNFSHDAIDLSHVQTPGWVHEHQPWGPQGDWSHDVNNTGDLQNHLNELFEVKYDNVNKLYDWVRMNFVHHGDAIESDFIIRGEGCDGVGNNQWNDFVNSVKDKNILNLIYQKKFDGGAGGWGQVWWFYTALSNELNTKQLMFGFDNVLKVNDFGYDSGSGYWYKIGLNKDFLTAAEGERYNPYAFQQWKDEKDTQGDRVLWINPADMTEQPAGTYEVQRDKVFDLIVDFMNKRVITYDNYETVRKWIHDKCSLNKQIINLETIKQEIENNPELQNSGWPYFSNKYNVENCPDLWDWLILVLPSTNYTIQHSYNAQEDAQGAWGTLQKQEPMSYYQLTSNDNKVYIGDPGPQKGYAFQANCNVLYGDQDADNPLHIDTWDSKYKIDRDGNKVDADINLTSYTSDQLTFLFRNTLEIPNDPQQHSGERGIEETYFHVGPNFEKLCAVENEKPLHIVADKQLTPSVAWNVAQQQGATTEDHIKSMVADADGNPSPVFAYKKLDGSMDGNLPNEMLQVVPHNNEGTIEIRLFDPAEQYVAWSTNLTGFKKDESSANINFDFKTPFDIATKKESGILKAEANCSVENAFLTYESSDESLVQVLDVADKGTKFKLKTNETAGQATIVAKLWYPDGLTLIDQASFMVNITPSPESVEIISTPDLEQEIKTEDFKEGYIETPFQAEVHPKEAGNVKWQLQPYIANTPLPEWLHIGQDNGFVYWENAQEGNYSFYVTAISTADETVYTSKVMTLGFGVPVNPENKEINIPAIVGGTVGGVAIVGAGTGFGVFTYKRRRGPTAKHKGGK